jgi:2-alkenal reductase
MWLTVRSGERAGQLVRVLREELVIGRDESCDLVIADANASRRHASLRELPDGRVVLRDLGSANGSYVNGERVDSALLSGGEQLQFGDTVLVAAPEPAAAPAAGSSARSDSLIQRVERAVLRKSRRTALAVALAVVLAAIGALFALGVLPSEDREGVAAEVVEKAAPATVLIEVADENGSRAGTGSGFVLDARAGLIVTNFHVINDGVRFRVGARGGLRPARVVGAAPCEDLALLRVDDRRGLETLSLGSQAGLHPGERVVALGFPGNASLADELASTEGIVSVASTSYRETALDVPEYENVIQTDAAVNPGNSGGPLLDSDGKLVGVNSAGRTRSPDGRVVQGQSYAIGVDRVRQVLATLRRGRSIGWTGLTFRYPTVESLSSRRLPQGLYASGSVRGSPAAEAGLGAGSQLVVGVDGRPLANTLRSYCDAVEGIASGQVATFSVIPPGGRRPREVRVRFG